MTAAEGIERFRLYFRALDKIDHIDDKALLWFLSKAVIPDVELLSYQDALISKLEDRLYPEYDGDKVVLTDYGWSTPEGAIVYDEAEYKKAVQSGNAPNRIN